MLSKSNAPPNHCKAFNFCPSKTVERITAVRGSRSVATVSAVGFKRAAPQLNASNANAAARNLAVAAAVIKVVGAWIFHRFYPSPPPRGIVIAPLAWRL